MAVSQIASESHTTSVPSIRHGTLPLGDLHSLLHLYGYVVPGADAVKHLADCMNYERRLGRIRRTVDFVIEAEAVDGGVAGFGAIGGHGVSFLGLSLSREGRFGQCRDH